MMGELISLCFFPSQYSSLLLTSSRLTRGDLIGKWCRSKSYLTLNRVYILKAILKTLGIEVSTSAAAQKAVHLSAILLFQFIHRKLNEHPHPRSTSSSSLPPPSTATRTRLVRALPFKTETERRGRAHPQELVRQTPPSPCVVNLNQLRVRDAHAHPRTVLPQRPPLPAVIEIKIGLGIQPFGSPLRALAHALRTFMSEPEECRCPHDFTLIRHDRLTHLRSEVYRSLLEDKDASDREFVTGPKYEGLDRDTAQDDATHHLASVTTRLRLLGSHKNWLAATQSACQDCCLAGREIQMWSSRMEPQVVWSVRAEAAMGRVNSTRERRVPSEKAMRVKRRDKSATQRSNGHVCLVCGKPDSETRGRALSQKNDVGKEKEQERDPGACISITSRIYFCQLGSRRPQLQRPFIPSNFRLMDADVDLEVWMVVSPIPQGPVARPHPLYSESERLFSKVYLK
ncbi:hypothetical protein B0H12DRAFT_1070830 [Mycena haematopus]|nr:hypothetical protein B0H12DRAFT_1070830 [Mycena haematopus]